MMFGILGRMAMQVPSSLKKGDKIVRSLALPPSKISNFIIDRLFGEKDVALVHQKIPMNVAHCSVACQNIMLSRYLNGRSDQM